MQRGVWVYSENGEGLSGYMVGYIEGAVGDKPGMPAWKFVLGAESCS